MSQQFNYGEALQKSILFYETQQSGRLPDWNRISWRGDAGVTDGQDVGLDLTGGWFDAGDHIKFGFPMAFSVSALNWGYLEYKDGYETVNQSAHFKRNIKWVTDYFLKCHVAPNEFYGQISAKNPDHNFWMPAEMVDVHPQYGVRTSHKIDAQHPGTELACETAAALASASLVFKDSDPNYSATLLQHAKELYAFGDTYRGKYNEEGGIPATGTYSSGGYEDELAWGAVWLYKATGEQQYLEKAEAEYKAPDFKWSLVWDDKSYGAMVLLAELTGKQIYKDDAERHLDFWLDNGNGINYSPGGQAHLTEWGSLRHSMNAALTAFIYSDKVDTSRAQEFRDFAVAQVNYALGDNPNNRSLVTGIGENPPTKPHHRGQHSSWLRSEDDPVDSRHTLIGALIGGPLKNDDVFVENRSDFQANEVACDYNACYQGVLARMVMSFGGTALANYPQPEVAGQEFLTEARLNSTGAKYSEPALWLNNRTGWPARVPETLRARYFIDISEGIAAGLTAGDYEITGRGDGQAIGGLQVWDEANNIYYVEVEVDADRMPFPGGRGEYRTEVQMRVGIPNDMPESAWDPTNDFSYQGLNNTLKEMENIPIYANGILVGGNEPDGSGNRKPIAVLETDTISGIAPLEVAFDASASSDPEGSVLEYSWDFGNGQTATSVAPSITYNDVGTYTVTLTVNDGERNSEAVTTTVTVTDSMPVAAFTASTVSGVIPLTVDFDATTSVDPTGGALTYSWDLGNGQTASTVTTSATYVDLGTVTVTLTVTNAAGETDTTSQTIRVTEEQENSCTFGTPTAVALPSINDRFDNAYILGDGGPDLSRIREFSINWDLNTNGLHTFAVGLTEAPWYVDLEANLTYNFSASNPEIIVSGTGTLGLDGAYWVTLDEGNFVMVSKTEGYTLYFTDANTAPECNIDVSTVDGGTLSGGPFNFTVGDGIADNVSGIGLTGQVGEGSQWIVTDANNVILGLPGTPEAVNFDGAGAGVCLIWHLSYNGTLTGAVVDNTLSDITGDSDLSNAITVNRTAVNVPTVDGGTLSGGPFNFTVGDGIADNVSGVGLTGQMGEGSQWIVTDANNVILGLPGTPEAVNFDGAGAGVCLIWHLSYNGTLTGAVVDNTLSDITGDSDLSNAITVNRTAVNVPTVDGGTLSGGPFNFTVGDGIADNVSGIGLTGQVGEGSQWIVTDANNVILGLPGTPEAVNFDGAGAGVCLIWHLSYNGTLTGAVVDNTLSDITGDSDLSNAITVNRTTEVMQGDCTFGTPQATAIQTLNQRYANVYVLGSNGPDLSLIRTFSINWSLENNSLHTFAVNLNQTPWYVDLRPNITYNFNTVNPEVTVSGTGIINLDGAYWVTIDNGNVVLVSKNEGYTLYFTDADSAPNCSSASSKSISNFEKEQNRTTLSISPNPGVEVVALSSDVNLKGTHVYVFDMTGKRIKNFVISKDSTKHVMPIHDLAAGVYIVKLFNAQTGVKAIQQFVKQN